MQLLHRLCSSGISMWACSDRPARSMPCKRRLRAAVTDVGLAYVHHRAIIRWCSNWHLYLLHGGVGCV